MKKLSIVIPCYNEKGTVRELLARVLDAPTAGWEKEVIVVDDYSKDGTREILKDFEDRLRVLYQEKNGGKGTAVRTGIAACTGSYVLIQDADLEYDPYEIKNLLSALDKGEGDVIYGSRNLGGNKREGFWIPRLGVWFITVLLNAMYGLRLTDAWTCYKLFPIEEGRHFKSGGFDSELLFTAAMARDGLRFAEVAISHYPRDVGSGKKIRYRDGIKSILLLISDRLLHIKSGERRTAYKGTLSFICPLCRGALAGGNPSYVCTTHGAFEIDATGRPLLIPGKELGRFEEEHTSGINWPKSFLKQFPKVYYLVWHFFCPVLMIVNGPRRIFRYLPKDALVLDVGSGPERLAKEFVNVDIFPFPTVDVVGDATRLPFKDNSVDGVVSESVLEHVEDPVVVTKEMVRVLRPGGILYASAPFIHPYHASPDDFTRFTTSGLRKLFPDLEIIEGGVRSGPWGAFLMFFAYWLGVIFSLGSRRLAPFLAHVFMLVLGPLKYLDLIFMSFPGAEAVAAHLYIIGRKK